MEEGVGEVDNTRELPVLYGRGEGTRYGQGNAIARPVLPLRNPPSTAATTGQQRYDWRIAGCRWTPLALEPHPRFSRSRAGLWLHAGWSSPESFLATPTGKLVHGPRGSDRARQANFQVSKTTIDRQRELTGRPAQEDDDDDHHHHHSRRNYTTTAHTQSLRPIGCFTPLSSL